MGSVAYQDGRGNLFLSDRVKFPFVNLADNKTHTVRRGDTLRSIAAHAYSALSTDTFFAASLYWVIADFQPEAFPAVTDPSLTLPVGTQLIIPSARTVQDRILPNLSKLLSEVL